ncbi:hypothetical protein WKI65_38845 [Streptomyces sp. MS1.AVA.3]
MYFTEHPYGYADNGAVGRLVVGALPSFLVNIREPTECQLLPKLIDKRCC